MVICGLTRECIKRCILDSKQRRKTFKEVIDVINKSKRVIKTITFMLGDNSRADDDQERKRYKSPPPPPAADDDEDDIEDDPIEEEKIEEEDKEEEEEEEESSQKEFQKVPKLVHSVSGFFLAKNLEEEDVGKCPSSPRKTKATTSLAETMIKTELEMRHQGGASTYYDVQYIPNTCCDI